MALLIDRFRGWLVGTPCVHEPDTPPRPCEGARDVVLMIDVSVSMDAEDYEPSRLGAAKKAALAFIEQLAQEEPDAHVAVVAYGSDARTVCGLLSVRDLGPIRRAIEGLTTTSATNITAGLREALDLLPSRDAAVGQVIVLSDGHHNSGKKPHAIARELRQRATIECVGIGGSPADVDEKLLRAVASSHPDGTKRYRWIGDGAQLVQHYRRLAGRIARS